jgi:hypothetical protein
MNYGQRNDFKGAEGVMSQSMAHGTFAFYTSKYFIMLHFVLLHRILSTAKIANYEFYSIYFAEHDLVEAHVSLLGWLSNVFYEPFIVPTPIYWMYTLFFPSIISM